MKQQKQDFITIKTTEKINDKIHSLKLKNNISPTHPREFYQTQS